MKQLLKLFSIVFCAMALYACGSDDEPGKSALQDQFIDVDNSGKYACRRHSHASNCYF